MMKIYTLTLCPAYDVHAISESFAASKENTVTVTSIEAGGKGVNISRALHACGTESTAIVALGRENDAQYRKELMRCGFPSRIIEQAGRIRENITIHCRDNTETRICFEELSDQTDLLEKLDRELTLDNETVVTVTGRMPKNISEVQRKSFIERLKSAGAKVVIDSKSFSIEELAELKPWLIKPNQEEITASLGYRIDGIQDVYSKRDVIESLGIENVLVSFGGEGAVLFHNGKVHAVSAPSVPAISTIGAGDSMIAGFLSAEIGGCGPNEKIKAAVAFGTAACLTEGTRPPCLSDIKEIYRKMI